MKKIGITCVALVLTGLLLTGCGGNVLGVQRDYGRGAPYSAMEIRSAMDLVALQFMQGFRGCTLKTLAYDDEATDREGAEWGRQYEEDEVLVLTSSFYVGPHAEGSLQPNSTYDGWKWILTRSNGGFWTLRTWGYG